MQVYTYLKNKISCLSLLGFAFVGLISCGSYDYAAYEDDGIYDSDTTVVTTREVAMVQTTNSDSNHYENYFAKKSEEYSSIPEEDLVFTDIDNYTTADEGTEIFVEGSNVEYETTEGYASWEDSYYDDEVNIYVYNNYRPWGWGWNAGWGWNNWGWNAGWGGYYCPSYWGGTYYGPGYAYGYGYRRGSVNNGYRRAYASNVRGRRGNSILNRDFGSRRRAVANHNNGRRASATSARPTRPTHAGRPASGSRPSARPTGRPTSRPSARPSTKPSRPSARPSGRPASRPSARPSSRPSTKPSSRPSTRPSSRPSTRPSSRPSSRPSYRSGSSRSGRSFSSPSRGSSRSSGSRSSGRSRSGRF